MSSSHSHDHAPRPELAAVLQQLRDEGFRLTQPRREIVSSLLKAKKPIEAKALELQVKKVIKNINKTTVYRELAFLVSKSLVLEIDLMDGKKRYEWARDAHDHHHHMICTKCQQASCVDLCVEFGGIEKYLLKEHGFTLSHHVLEFFGVCQDCQKA